MVRPTNLLINNLALLNFVSELTSAAVPGISVMATAVSLANGYYYRKYFNSADCTGAVTFVEGYSTGVCLQTSGSNSVTLVGRGTA